MSDLSWRAAALGFAAEGWCTSKDELFTHLRKVHSAPPSRREFREWAKSSEVLPGLLRPVVSVVEDDPGFVEIPVIRRDYSHLSELKTYPLGDVHIGSPAHHQAKWLDWLAYISKGEGTSFLGTGDFLNSALKTSVSDSYEEVLTVGAAKRQLISQLEPLRDRIDILIPGNHEDRIWKAVGDCPIEDAADRLGAPYARASALLIYTVGDQEYKVYVRHGTGNGQSPTTLLKSAAVIHADLYVTGHTHRQGCILEDVFVHDDVTDRIGRQPRRFLSSGSFLWYERYCATRGYQPSHLGSPRISFSGREKDCRVSV